MTVANNSGAELSDLHRLLVLLLSCTSPSLLSLKRERERKVFFVFCSSSRLVFLALFCVMLSVRW